jgi:glycosyltransferase involved in cell wall biosynthesis
MKILHIIPSLEIGGAQRLTFDICNELWERPGIQIKLIIFRDVNEFGERPFISLIPSSIKLSFFQKNKFHVAKLQQEIESFNPDIIHSHLFMAEIVSRSCLYKDAIWFSHFHDNMPQLNNVTFQSLGSKTGNFNFYEKQYLYKGYKLNGGNNFIAISQNAFDYARRVIPKSDSLKYLKNAIDYEAFYSPVKAINSKKIIRLLNVGSFQKKKNQLFLVDILKKLLERGINCDLTFLGAGREMKHVENRAEELGVKDQIIFKGNVTNVRSFLAESDIYVHSAYYEPFGLVLLEAMAAGLPVVCLNGGGNADIIESGVNGWMIDPLDGEKFTKKIKSLIENKEDYKKIAERGQETAKEYGIQIYCDKLIAIYSASLEKT